MAYMTPFKSRTAVELATQTKRAKDKIGMVEEIPISFMGGIPCMYPVNIDPLIEFYEALAEHVEDMLDDFEDGIE